MPGYADRSGDFAQSIDDRPGDAIYANLVFSYIEGVSLRQKLGQLRLEGIDIGDRARR